MPLALRLSTGQQHLRVTVSWSLQDDSNPSLLRLDFHKITLGLTPVWLKGRGQGGWKGLEVQNYQRLVNESLIEADLLAGALNVNMCKKHDEPQGGLQVLMGRVQVLFSGDAYRMGLKGGRVRDEGNSAKSP